MTTIDPICGMTIEAATAVASATVNGETYYFCSSACETMFQQSQEEEEPASACCSARAHSCC